MAAFDTENKRRSSLNTAIYRNLPIADGVIGLDDRAMMLYQYAHDSFPVPPAPTLFIKLVMTEKRANITHIMKRSDITFLKIDC